MLLLLTFIRLNTYFLLKNCQFFTLLTKLKIISFKLLIKIGGYLAEFEVCF